jgi:hypothetical protein
MEGAEDETGARGEAGDRDGQRDRELGGGGRLVLSWSIRKDRKRGPTRRTQQKKMSIDRDSNMV